MLNLNRFVRSLTARATRLIDRLIGSSPCACHSPHPTAEQEAYAPKPATTEVVEKQTVAEAKVEMKETEPAPIIETPVLEVQVTVEPPTNQCCNRMHPQTRKQCTNRVWLDNESQLCGDCVQKCWGGCGHEVFWWHTHCDTCRKQGRIKRCENCGVLIRLGHKLCAPCQPATPRSVKQTMSGSQKPRQYEAPAPRHKCGRKECYRMIPEHYPYCETHRP
jgi:hypothetical protein